MSQPTHTRHLSAAQQRSLVISRKHNAAALLTAEGRLQAGLERALAFGTGYAAGSGLGLLRSASRGIAAAFAATILAGRRAARRAGRDRMLDELGIPGRDIETADSLAADKRRARQTAAAFAGYWLASARKSLDVAGSERAAIGEANGAQLFRLRMDATTEASTAYTAERSAVARAIVPLTKHLAVVPWKVWCSALEKETCDQCAGAHGEMVVMSDDFKLGEPGDVHPRCLCWFDVVWLLSSGGEADELEAGESLAELAA
jgi:hypothetical protein